MATERPFPAEDDSADRNGHYDVVVLGAGSGGYTAAIRSSQLGMRTAVVEREFWGGICLNIGCIPSKALLTNAELAELLTRRTREFGIHANGPIRVDYAEAVARSRAVVDARVRGVNYLLRKNNIDAFSAHGRFADPHHLELSDPDSGEPLGRLSFDHCIIDVGATPNLLPDTKVGPRVRTYAEQITDPALPDQVVIVGAGAIGVEFAYLLNSFGTKVTLLEAAERILPLEDADVSAELSRRYRRAGIAVHAGVRVAAIEEAPSQVAVHVEGLDASSQVLTADLCSRPSDSPLEPAATG